MNREQLEHAIRAAGAISGDRELYVVGSQSRLLAGRQKDHRYIAVLFRESMVEPTVVERRLAESPSLDRVTVEALRARLSQLQDP